MNLEQLHRYLGLLIEGGTPKDMPVVFPMVGRGNVPQEIVDVILVNGTYQKSPDHLTLEHFKNVDACLMFAGPGFDLHRIREIHGPQWHDEDYLSDFSADGAFYQPDDEPYPTGCPYCGSELPEGDDLVLDEWKHFHCLREECGARLSLDKQGRAIGWINSVKRWDVYREGQMLLSVKARNKSEAMAEALRELHLNDETGLELLLPEQICETSE